MNSKAPAQLTMPPLCIMCFFFVFFFFVVVVVFFCFFFLFFFFIRRYVLQFSQVNSHMVKLT